MDTLTLGTPATYRITIQGCLNSSWSASFSDMVISNEFAENGSVLSVLTGPLDDQAALFGVLEHLYGLGFPLRSVECLEINSTE
jgi:hypothetical protein